MDRRKLLAWVVGIATILLVMGYITADQWMGFAVQAIAP